MHRYTMYAGEEITLWQRITIYGPDGDLDGNGVDDTLQPCPFIVGKLQDGDNDEIDDRCDSEIKQAQESIYSPRDTPQSYDDQQPRFSNFASDAAKALLVTGPYRFAQHLPAHDSINTPALQYDRQGKDEQPLNRTKDDNAQVIKQQMKAANFTLINISIVVILCIITLIGFTYVKTHSKK